MFITVRHVQKLILTMNKFIEKWMIFVSVLHFFTRVNSECSRFKRLLCIRAEKNLELSKTSKMEPLEKIVKIFCNNIYLRCLTGFKYTSEDYLFWKYPEI